MKIEPKGQSWQSSTQKAATTAPITHFRSEPLVQSCPSKELTSLPENSLHGQAEVYLLQVQKQSSLSKPALLLLLQVVVNTLTRLKSSSSR